MLTGTHNVSEEVRRAAGRPCGPCAGAGSPLRARVALAAYCNDLPARLAILGAHNPAAHEIPPGMVDVATAPFPSVRVETGTFPLPEGGHTSVRTVPDSPFAEWVRGLQRWADVGRHASWLEIVAVRAGAGVVHAVTAVPSGKAEDVLNLCDAWLDRPTQANADAWGNAACEWSRMRPDDRRYGVSVPFPGTLQYPARSSIDARTRIADAARLAGEAPVREAIQRSLIAWALSPGEP